MKTDLRTYIAVATAFLFWYFLFRHFSEIHHVLDAVIPLALVNYFVTYLIIGTPVFLATWLIHRDIRIYRYLGLDGSPLKGLLYAIMFTTPMFVGGILCFEVDPVIDPERTVKGTWFAGFFEELYFRGFLFGILFRYTRLGFIPAIVAGALLFAAGHLSQSPDPGELAGVFLVTFMGAVLFAWLYAEWAYNLWIPVFLHALMNLAWEVYALGDTAAGGWTSNILRGLTIALAIVSTIVIKKNRGQTFEINRRTLFLK